MDEIVSNALQRVTPSLCENITIKEATMFARLKHIDIMAVMSGSKLIGELRFLDVLNYLIPKYASEEMLRDVLDIQITKVMNQNINKILIGDDYNKIFQKIKDSKIGTVFVTDCQDSLLGCITLLDLIPIVLEKIPPSFTINDLDKGEKLITGNQDDTIYDIISLMLEKHVRRIVIDGDPLRIIDDQVLKTMFNNNSESTKTMNTIFSYPVNNFLKEVTMIPASSQFHDVARKIQCGDHCVITENHEIITPWDIIITANDLQSKPKFHKI